MHTLCNIYTVFVSFFENRYNNYIKHTSGYSFYEDFVKILENVHKNYINTIFFI